MWQGTRINDLHLAWVLARRDLSNRYAASYFGFVWTIGVPLVYALINIVVFSMMMRGRMGDRYADVPFTVFYFIALSQWILFAEAVPRSAGIVREYSYLLRTRVGFPAWIIPILPLASAAVTQLVVISLGIASMVANDIIPSTSAVLFIFVTACTVILTLGVSYIVAAISVYVPDMSQAVPIFVTMLFWLTPILYPPSMLEGAPAIVRHLILTFNPFYYLTETARLAVLGTIEPVWPKLLVPFVFGVSVLVVGHWIFRKLRPGFTDVL
ncbi:ABC transporter permease [Nitratireductor aquibiodomus]|uniref:ABC transporter permease n=1 Tax=Nitratireductor aquibiodomus TaxID=204799 RepID=UPI00046987A3|nr:ABC transporter permease [Nitratireductor aquibiodomus]